MSALPAVGHAEAVLGTDATSVLYERYSNRILAYCVTRLGTREEAEDAMQTTFLNAFRSMRSGVVPRFELAWLFRIADNVCRDGRKAAWRRGRVEATRDLQELQDVLPSPEHGDDGLIGISEALASLPERQRQAILLREWQGLTYAEIARELELSNAAVETLIFRARRSLAEALEGRRAAGFNVLTLLSAAKSFLQGAATVKVAASVLAAGGVALAVAVPLRDGPRPAATLDTRAPAAAPGAPTQSPAATVDASPSVGAPAGTRREKPAESQSRTSATGGFRRSSTVSDRAPGSAKPASDPTDARVGSPPVVTAATPGSPAPEQPVAAPPSSPVPPPPAPPVALPSLPTVPELPPVVPPLPPLPPPAVPPLPETPPLNLPELPPLPPLPALP